MGQTFGSEEEFRQEQKRRAGERSAQANVARAAKAGDKLATLGLRLGSEFIDDRSGSMFLCRVTSLARDRDLLVFEVIAANVTWRSGCYVTSGDVNGFVSRVVGERNPSFADKKQKVLEAQSAFDQKALERKAAVDGKKEQQEKEREERKARKEAALVQFRSEIHRQNFVIGGRVMSPAGVGFIRDFNEEKLTVVLTISGKAGRRAFHPSKLSWLVT